MAKYELLCVFPGTLAEDELPTRIEALTATITDQGGENISMDNMGKNRLAYPMKHIRYGYFYRCLFDIERTQVSELQNKLRIGSDLLRILITQYDEEKQSQYKQRIAELQSQTEKPQMAASEEKKEEKKPKKETKKEEPSTTSEEKEEKKEDIEEIDKKLDEILDQSIADV